MIGLPGIGFKTIPTHDIYFRHPLRHLIREDICDRGERPIRRLSNNCFATDQELVIIRYLEKRELVRISRRQWSKVFYVIDDDLANLEMDFSVPEDYRKRLLDFKRSMLPEILKIADVIVAPNQAILNGYPNHSGLHLDPCHISLCPDLSHFDKYETVRILFPGTRSHLGDLEFLADTLRGICEDIPHVQLVTYLGENAPSSLRGVENIQNRKPRTWQNYKKEQSRERFHISLVPTLDTPFNRARSINKLFDCAAVGAAGIYSEAGPLAELIQNGVDGLLIENSPKAWDASVRVLISERDRTKRLAQKGLVCAGECGSLRKVQDFWTSRIQIES